MPYGSDGHTGVSNQEVNRGAKDHFEFVLSHLKQASGDGVFVVHAHYRKFYTAGLQPWDFLLKSGLAHYEGTCPFFRDECIYTVVGAVERDAAGTLDQWRVQGVHERFKRLVDGCDKVYEAGMNYVSLASKMGLNPALVDLVGKPIQIDLDPSAIPPWVDDVKCQR